MKEPSVHVPRTFKLGLPLQIVFPLIWGTFVALSIYGWATAQVTIGIPALLALGLLVNLWWIRTVRLELTQAGFTFRSGLYARSLDWADVDAISFRDNYWATSQGAGGDLAMIVWSNNASKKTIKMNRMYFSKYDLRDFVLTAMVCVPRLKLDPAIVRTLEKMGAPAAKQIVH